MSLAGHLLVSHARAATRRAARERRRTLERELADYASSTDLCDLEAILDRYPDGATHELREILAQQAFTRKIWRRRCPGLGTD